MPVGDTALADLRAYPRAFLENNALVIYGLNQGSGAADFRLYQTDRKWRSSVGGDLRDVPLWSMYGDGEYPSVADATTGSAAFPVHYVSMREFKQGAWENAATTHHLLPTNAGSDLMVTSKLNGCTFGLGSDGGGGRLVSHLRPPNMAGAQDEVSRGTEAGFQARGHTIDYRVGSALDRQATIVGLRSGTSWTLWVQRFKMIVMTGTIDLVTKLT